MAASVHRHLTAREISAVTTPLQVKKSYNFTLYPASILGVDFRNVLVMAIMDFDSAMALADVAALHTQVYPMLPQDVPDDPSQYNFVKVKTEVGVTILGIPWINAATIQEVTKQRLRILIEDADVGDIDIIRSALSLNGFNKFSIATETIASN